MIDAIHRLVSTGNRVELLATIAAVVAGTVGIRAWCRAIACRRLVSRVACSLDICMQYDGAIELAHQALWVSIVSLLLLLIPDWFIHDATNITAYPCLYWLGWCLAKWYRLGDQDAFLRGDHPLQRSAHCAQQESIE